MASCAAEAGLKTKTKLTTLLGLSGFLFTRPLWLAM
ncbi:hypothetical protein ACUW9M_002170 [Serratia sp. 121840015-2]